MRLLGILFTIFCWGIFIIQNLPKEDFQTFDLNLDITSFKSSEETIDFTLNTAGNLDKIKIYIINESNSILSKDSVYEFAGHRPNQIKIDHLLPGMHVFKACALYLYPNNNYEYCDSKIFKK